VISSAPQARTTLTATGNAQVSTAKSVFGQSLYINGTGQLASTDSMAMTGDYTIELWINPITVTGTTQTIWRMGDENTGRTVMWLENDATFRLDTFGGGGTPDWSGGGGFYSNVLPGYWYHIAYVRQSGTVRIYVNGVQAVTGTSNVDFNSGGFVIGSSFNGYMDEFRISSTARYPDGTTFTPSTSVFQNDASTKCLYHFDGANAATTFTDDESGTYTFGTVTRWNNTFTVNGSAVTSTTSPKFGTASLRLPSGSSDLRTTIPHTAVADNSNWTIEGWVNLDNTTFNGYQYLINTATGGLNLRGFGGANNTLLEYYIVDKNGANAVNWNGDLNGASTELTGTWYHFALQHYNDTFYLYGNGNLVSTRGGYSANYNLTGASTSANNWYLGTNNFAGYIDELRVSDVARYPLANFTPPTAEFTNDYRTVALLKMNGSNNGTVFEDTQSLLNQVTNVYLNGQSTATSTSIAIPNSAKANDIAVLFDMSTTVTDVTPTNWTSISKATTTGIRTNISYKRLTASDLGTNVSGMGGTTRKIMLVYTPNALNRTLTISTPTSQATSLTPNNIGVTAGSAPSTTPVISFWCGGSTGAPSTTLANSTEYRNVSTSGLSVRTIQWNQGQTPANQTASMTDTGTNTFQGFFIRFS
jgi:hypothetical protein